MKRGLAAVASLLVLAGCGEDRAHQDFARAYAAERTELRRVGSDLVVALEDDETRSNAELAAQLGVLDGRLNGVIARLERLEAPPEVSVRFRSLRGALGRLDRGLPALGAVVAAGDLDRAQPLGAQLVLEVQAVERARQALEARLRGG